MLFLAGGLLMVAGAGCFAFLLWREAACWVFLAGAILFVIAGLLMVDTAYQFMRDAFTDLTTYLEIIYNKWVLVLLVAALLEMYTMHRMAAILKKTGE